MPPSPFDPLSRLDPGDYRRAHEGGTGPCTIPPEPSRFGGEGPDGGNVVRHDS